MSKLYKHINIDILPTKNGIGANYNKQIIDWDKSIGYILNFEYGEIKGDLKIVYYKRLKLIVEYLNEKYEIGTESLKTCNLGKILKVRTREYKINIGETITDNNRNLTILNREYRIKTDKDGFNKYEKWYYFKCNDCGEKNWKIEGSLISQKCGCPVCYTSSTTPVEGINTIVDTDKWMIQYFQGGYDEAKLYKKFSNKKINAICPDCGKIHYNTPIKKICSAKTLNCSCSDGWSYPNKFIFSLLKQLNTNFEAEKSFPWSENKIYDDYVLHNNMKIIIENHGMFHYMQNKMNKRTLKEEQENDRQKEQLAKENGIEHYIVLDCRKSELEWIKKSVMDSELPTLLNFTEDDIDWLKCEEYALNNLAKKACMIKNNNKELFVTDIAKMLNISSKCVRDYLKKGNKIGWCCYNPKEEIIRSGKMVKKNQMNKPVMCVELNLYFRSSCICQDILEDVYNIKTMSRNIRSVCNGKRNICGGLRFKHISQEEFNNFKSDPQTSHLCYGDYFIIQNEDSQAS